MWITGSKLTELLLVLGVSTAVKVTANDVNEVVARIPVSIVVVCRTVAVVILRSPYIDEVVDAFLAQTVEKRLP